MGKKINDLIKNINILITEFNDWGYRKELDFYFYKIIMEKRKRNNLVDLLREEKNNKFIALIYSTLITWDMASRGAKINNFNKFNDSIIKNKSDIIELDDFKLKEIELKHDFEKIKQKLRNLYGPKLNDGLQLMRSKAKLVAFTKTMHYLLPNLMMPMDRENVMTYFYGNENVSLNKFLEIFEASWIIARNTNLRKFLDNGWNQTIPKIIDNAIIFMMQRKTKIERGINDFKDKIVKAEFGIPKSIANELSKIILKKIQKNQQPLY